MTIDESVNKAKINAEASDIKQQQLSEMLQKNNETLQKSIRHTVTEMKDGILKTPENRIENSKAHYFNIGRK